MKKFDFNHSGKQWDQYRAFYRREGVFVEFETGELMITDARPDPHLRRYYDRYGIQLVGTGDKECPPLYTSKEAEESIKPAWLNQGGQQYVAIDRERGVAVRLKSSWSRGGISDNMQSIPSHVESAKALWTGPNRMPIPLNQFTVSLPDRAIRNSLAKKLNDAHAAIAAIYRIETAGEERLSYYGAEAVQAVLAWDDMSTDEIVSDILGTSQTNPHHRNHLVRNIALRGFTFPRAETKHDFLYIK